MAGLLDYLSPPSTGNGGMGLLDYLTGPLYQSPLQRPYNKKEDNADFTAALRGDPYAGSMLGAPPVQAPVFPAYNAPPTPTVFDTGSGNNLGGFSFGPQGPAPQAAPQAPPPMPAPVQVGPQTPQADNSVLPPNATPAQGQLPTAQQVAAPQNAPLPSAFGGGGIQSYLQNLHNGGGLFTSGMDTPQQQAARTSYNALREAGASNNEAMAASLNPALFQQIAPQYFSKNQPIAAGTDPFTGRTHFVRYDARTGNLVPLSETGSSGPGAGNERSLESFQKAVDSGVTGEALYNYLPKDYSETIKAWIDGRRPGPTGMALKNPAILNMVNAAHTIDPTFDEGVGPARFAGLKSWKSGTDAESARRAEQSALHFGELVQKMQQLPGSPVPSANAAANFFNTQLLGKGQQNNFMVNAHALADELSGIWKGHNISDTEIRAWESQLSPNMSVEQQRGMAKTLLGLYRDGVAAMEKKKIQSIGPAAAAQVGPILGPNAEAALAGVEKFANGGQPQGNKPQTVIQNGHTYILQPDGSYK